MRFNYSAHRTREQAEQALEQYYGSGEVCEGEHPTIVRRKYTSGKVWFVVEIDG